MERIILGSADVYIQAFDGSTVPVTADICKPENLMAYISGGASVEYKPSFCTAKAVSYTHLKGRHWKEEQNDRNRRGSNPENRNYDL